MEATLTNKHFSNTMHFLERSTRSSCMYLFTRGYPAAIGFGVNLHPPKSVSLALFLQIRIETPDLHG
jgi:hypothetical protein